MNDDGMGCGCLLVILLAVGAIWIFNGWNAPNWFREEDEIVSYGLGCGTPYKNGKCAGYEFRLNPTHYKINRAKNEVVYMMPSIGTTPRTLINCTIFDVENWSCSYSDGSGKVEFKDGIEYAPNEKRHRYVAGWEYRLYSLKSWWEKL